MKLVAQILLGAFYCYIGHTIARTAKCRYTVTHVLCILFWPTILIVLGIKLWIKNLQSN